MRKRRNRNVIDTLNPVVTLFTPRDNATRVSLSVNLVMAFGEFIQKGAGSILIKRSSDGSAVEAIPVESAQVTVSGATATIDPAALLLESTDYYAEVSAGAFRDLAGNDFAGINGGATWNFTTVGPLVVDDAVTTQEDTLIRIDVLSNDLGIGWPVDPATLAIVSGPDHGTAVVDNGSVIYTPASASSRSHDTALAAFVEQSRRGTCFHRSTSYNDSVVG